MRRSMGVQVNVGYETFPTQSSWLGKKCRVHFKYNVEKMIEGTIVRDDIEQPFKTIIKLDDGRFILATECQYSPF